MNKTTLTIAAIAAPALAAVALASPAGASTHGCVTARFACGNVRSLASGSSMISLAWVADGKAGDPVVLGQERASDPHGDLRVWEAKGNLRFEVEPGGKPLEHPLCVGLDETGTYHQDGFTVHEGDLIQAGCDGSWPEGWSTGPSVNGGQQLISDYSGRAAAVVKVGQPIATVSPSAKRAALSWDVETNR